MKKILTLASVILTASCATQYVPTNSPEKAVLVLPVRDASWQFLGGFSSATVTFALKGENGCGVSYKPIKPAKDDDTKVDVDIPGNKDIFIAFNTNSGNSICSVTGMFRALPNFRYEVVNLGGGYQCLLGVVQIAQDGTKTQIKLEEAYRKEWTAEICDKPTN